jgi:hypothetical protein
MELHGGAFTPEGAKSMLSAVQQLINDAAESQAEVERLTALGDAMCTAARDTDYAMLHEACDKWEGR